jgi:hypothetical protein
MSANHELYGPFDFNKMPLALLGTKALVYNDPATRTSWASHATDGFYAGPSTNHYRCLHFYIPATQCFDSLTHGAYILAIAKSLPHLSTTSPCLQRPTCYNN